jgi:poly(glycerol-phosphate) alpha-glucosyltransferase
MFVADPPKKLADRPAGSGVMLARLSHQKRIHHAIQAVSHASADGRTQATLDVYGMDDDASEHLKTLIVDQGLDGIVTLRGYAPHAKQQFEHASFTLLTSEYEGQSLVLLEAMAAGCIPIAYDIAYGPADIITDGVDGFLVTAGDIEALGERIQQLTQMTDREIRKMRRAAMKSAKDFRPSVITSRWGKALKEALDSKIPVAVPHGRAELSSISTDARDLHLSVVISGEEVDHPDWAMLVWEQRRGIGFGRTPATARQAKGGTLVEGSIPLDILSRQMDKNVDFWIDLRVQGNPLRLRIKGVKLEEAVSSAQGIRFYGTKYGSLSADLVTDDES